MLSFDIIKCFKVKAKEVRKILRISNATLYRYCKDGLIERTKIGYHFDYDERSVSEIGNPRLDGEDVFNEIINRASCRDDADGVLSLENRVGSSAHDIDIGFLEDGGLDFELAFGELNDPSTVSRYEIVDGCVGRGAVCDVVAEVDRICSGISRSSYDDLSSPDEPSVTPLINRAGS